MSDTLIEWRPVVGFDGYEVSSRGDVRATGGRPLKPQLDGSDYLVLMIRRKKLRIHRAVLMAFVGPCPNGCEARHLDGHRHHNWLTNLAWGTRVENAADKRAHGTQPRGESAGTAKLSEEQVREIRQRIGTMSLRQLAAEYGVSHTAIRRAANRSKWSHVA